MKIDFKQLLNVPNMMSLTRIALVPVFVILYLNKNEKIATIILIISGLTDCVDGFVARHFNQVTEIGKMLDPFADKLTQVAVAVVLAIRYPVVAPLLLLFLVKEGLMLIGGFIMLRHGTKPSSAQWWGKLATIIFYGTMIAIVAFGSGLFGITLSNRTVVTLVSIAAVFMLFSFINYIPQFIKYCKDARNKKRTGGDEN